MSQFIINADGTIEQDKIFLCDRLLHKKGEIYPVDNLKIDAHLKSNWEVSFTIYKYNNGIEMPLWDKINDITVILVEGKGYFEIKVPVTNEDCIKKDVSGQSLCEAETSQTKITLQINTEDDISRDDYDEKFPTVLYRDISDLDSYKTIWDSNTKYTKYNEDGTINQEETLNLRKNILYESSLLHRIFKSMPNYTIGHVDESIMNSRSIFSCDDTSVYDFLQTIAEELECLFIFDKFSRTINCYKLDTYGKDSGVFIDGAENLAETITITGDKDAVKNCFKIQGGDDTITNRIGSRLIGGNYIWKFSKDQISQMSLPLQQALIQRDSLIQKYQSQYNELWDEYSYDIDRIKYYTYDMMPNEKTDDITAKAIFDELFGENGKITYACSSSKNQTTQAGAETILKSVLSYAKVIAPVNYTLQFEYVSYTNYTDDNTIASIKFSVHIFLTGQTEKNESGIDALVDEYPVSGSETVYVTLPVKKGFKLHADSDTSIFTTDYFLYLQQILDIAEEKNNVTDDIITFNPPLIDGEYVINTDANTYAEYDNESNPNNLPYNHYTMFGINRLASFANAYESCSQVIAKHNNDIASNKTDGSGSAQNILLKYIKINPDGTEEKRNIYDDLLGKYAKYMDCIAARQTYLQSKVDKYEADKKEKWNAIQDIRNQCDMQTYLENYENGKYGNELWIELCSFRRQDTYKNDNYIGDDMDESTLMQNVDELIKQAEKEIEKACEINYSVSATIGNLLVMPEFKSFWEDFTLGNYIHIRVDNNIYTLRLVTVSFDYTDVAHIPVEFSDIKKITESYMDQATNILKQASSLSSNFNFVARQAKQGEIVKKEFAEWQQYGLDVANTTIQDATNQEFVLNEYGITGRQWNDVTKNYDGEQLRIINNLLCFTDDAWQHTQTALGKICYYDNTTGEYKWDYGLNTGVLIGKLVMSEKLSITNVSGDYTINDNGFTMSKNNKFITFNPTNPSMIISSNNKNLLDFNSDGKGNLKFGEDVKLSWGNIDGVEISDDLIYAPNFKAGSVDAEHITGETISGLTFKSIGKNEGVNYQTIISDGCITSNVTSASSDADIEATAAIYLRNVYMPGFFHGSFSDLRLTPNNINLSVRKHTDTNTYWQYITEINKNSIVLNQKHTTNNGESYSNQLQTSISSSSIKTPKLYLYADPDNSSIAYQMIEKTVIIDIQENQEYIDITASGATINMPIFAMNGDYEANGFQVKGCHLFENETTSTPSANVIRIYITNASSSKCRLNIRYWSIR